MTHPFTVRSTRTSMHVLGACMTVTPPLPLLVHRIRVPAAHTPRTPPPSNPAMELMFAQLMKLAGRNEDASSAHHKYRPCPARCPSLQTYLPPPPPSLATICIAAQRTGDSNVMAFRNLLQSTFMQSILSFIPSLRHSLPALPQQAEATPPALSPTRAAPTPPVLTPVSVAPWKEEADRWKTLADTTAAERDELRHEAGRLHGELQRLVHDLGQVRAEAEEAWRTQEADLRREGAAALREAEERARAEAQEAVRRADENVQKAREELQALLAELEESRKEQGGLRDTLEARRVQLEELQRVVGEDKVGDADVMQLLKNLNEEIAKSALAVRDLFKLDRNSRPNGRVATDAAGAIEGWVGSALPGLLSKQYRGNAVLLQAALQAMAVAFSSWISSSYSFMHEHDQILDETYKFVMNSGTLLLVIRSVKN